MEPFEYTDKDGDLCLKIWPAASGGEAAVTTFDAGESTCAQLPPEKVPAAALALYEATGLPAPVVLPALPVVEAPGTQERPIVRAGFKAWRDHRGVHLTEVFPHEHDPERHWTDPADALELAAVIAWLAGKDEPDPDEVDRLAAAVHRAQCNTSVVPDPCDRCREVARLVLLGGWKRETDG